MDKELENNISEEEDELIELIDEEGHKWQYYLIATMDYKGKNYAFLAPGEEIEGAEEDDVAIFEIDEKNQMLLPLEDDVLLNEVFAEFERQYNEDVEEDETEN